MPVDVSWHQEGRIIRIQFYDDVNFDHIQMAYQDSTDLSANIPNTIHLIVDFTAVRQFPTHIHKFRDMIQLWQNFPNRGLVIIVGAKGLVRFVGNVVGQIAKLDFRMVDSLADAETLVARVDR